MTNLTSTTPIRLERIEGAALTEDEHPYGLNGINLFEKTPKELGRLYVAFCSEECQPSPRIRYNDGLEGGVMPRQSLSTFKERDFYRTRELTHEEIREFELGITEEAEKLKIRRKRWARVGLKEKIRIFFRGE
jgi:hypothetical protein